MSGGKTGGRGYLVQALVCVLESLNDPDWVTVAVDPDKAQEKVDIRWTYAAGRGPKVTQVKSREGAAFGKSDVVGLLKALKTNAKDAKVLELHLVGSVAEGAASLVGESSSRGISTRVVNLPLALEPLYRQAATGVEEVMRAAGFTNPPPPDARINAFKGLVTEVMAQAHILGTPLSRVHLHGTLLRYLSPPNLEEARRESELITSLRDLQRHTKLESLSRSVRDAQAERRRVRQSLLAQLSSYPRDPAGAVLVPSGDRLIVSAAQAAVDDILDVWLNAYDAVCAAFNNGSVDKDEFLALFGNEVKELFTEDGPQRARLEPRDKSPFKSIWDTYTLLNAPVPS